MGKAYKGKDCVYCGARNASSTADHVFARQFFPERRRQNLPKVPACASCNGRKSDVEHYLTTVLPFAGEHADAVEVLESLVPPRLARNQKLHSELAAGRSTAWIMRQNSLVPATTLLLDATKLRIFVRYIVRGLVAHHWNIVIPPDYCVGVAIWTEATERDFVRHIPDRGRAVAEASWGDGAFAYRGVQATDDPCLSVWQLQIYGGVLLGGDPSHSDEASRRIWVLTSQAPAADLFDY
jgi:hypothetical protein